MIHCAVLVFYVLISSFVQCSSIITKSMIRMPNSSFNSFTRVSTPPGSHQLPKPEMLVSSPFGDDLQPESLPEAEESVIKGMFDEEMQLDNTLDGNFVQVGPPKPSTNITSPKDDHKSFDTGYSKEFEDKNGKQPSVNLNTTISPQELSSKYWLQYKNFSNAYFNNLNFLDNSKTKSELEQRNQDHSVLSVFQRILRCFWISEPSSCVQTGFGSASLEDFSFLHLVSPRLPRFQTGESEEGPIDRSDRFPYSGVEDDEGRKRLSARLGQLIPFLLALKMSMLPALAVMALVSGKAFLMSLLSLGLAFLATLSAASPLRADKRQEFIPHHHPQSQPSDKYYYVM